MKRNGRIWESNKGEKLRFGRKTKVWVAVPRTVNNNPIIVISLLILCVGGYFMDWWFRVLKLTNQCVAVRL